MDKCGVCKRYYEGKNGCPCYHDIEDELCPFAFELIDIKEHDAKVRADAYKECRTRFQNTVIYGDFEKWLKEQIKEQK